MNCWCMVWGKGPVQHFPCVNSQLSLKILVPPSAGHLWYTRSIRTCGGCFWTVSAVPLGRLSLCIGATAPEGLPLGNRYWCLAQQGLSPGCRSRILLIPGLLCLQSLWNQFARVPTQKPWDFHYDLGRIFLVLRFLINGTKHSSPLFMSSWMSLIKAL